MQNTEKTILASKYDTEELIYPVDEFLQMSRSWQLCRNEFISDCFAKIKLTCQQYLTKNMHFYSSMDCIFE